MSETASVEVLVFGLVQGVFFRVFAQQNAEALGLTGYVKNISGGAVEAFAEGDKIKLEEFISRLETGPPGSKVERLEINWEGYSSRFNSFGIKY